MTTLETVLAGWIDDAAVLRRQGHAHDADLLDQCARQVRASDAEDFLTWLPEADAAMQAGRSVAWIRARFDVWRRDGHAKQVNRRTRLYRACVIPRRANLALAAEQGRRAADELERSA